MADNLPQVLGKQFAGLSRLPAQRQFGMILGLAVVIALGVTVALWGLRPSYQVLLPGMSDRDSAQAMSVLGRDNVPHRLDARTGALMVPSTRAAEARLTLATEGLPRAEGVGFELLDQDSGLGTSRRVEDARYQRALEGELARSVMTLNSVEVARVHLALPRQSVFVRERVPAGASVLVNLHPGSRLSDQQIAGIVHMVASSVPELEAERVTVVDQRGQLLSQTDNGSAASLSGGNLDYTRRVEDAFRQRIEDILTPLVGADGLRVQVTADVDFTQVESTREVYDPDTMVLRSEQTSEEESRGALTGGVPGALTNQPPGGAQVINPGDDAAGNGLAAEEAQAAGPSSRNRRSTRNYEVDRTISHIRQAPATLSRLSVAVVVDHRDVRDADGARTRVERDPGEMEHLTSLVREAVGFNEARGDRLNVVNASFREIEVPDEVLAQRAVWEEPWLRDLVRQGVAGLGLLLLVLLVLRPALRALAQPAPMARPALAGAGGAPAGLPGPDAGAALQGATAAAQAKRSLDDELERARKLAAEDPRLVAQVVKQWVHQDGK